MITAGIDVGVRTIKVVLVDDGKMLSYCVIPAGWQPREEALKALEEAVERAGITRDSIKQVTATGIGRKHILFATSFLTDVICDAKGITLLEPSVRTVIDIGAEGSRAVKCDASGKVLDFAANNKCAAGAGAFVESMARALEVTVEEMGDLSLKSNNEIPLNITCVIFGESEVVSLIHARTPKEDIARAIHDAIASRTLSMVRHMGVGKDVGIIGGVAKNVGVIESLRRQLGVNLLVPKNPQIAGALGAALLSPA